MLCTRVRIAAGIAAGLGVLGLAAACGDSAPAAGSAQQYVPQSGGVDAGSQGGGNGVTSTVAVMTLKGGKVLVDSTGAALYTNDQDTRQPKCASKDCVSIWVPLTVPTGQQPTAGPGVGGTISTVHVGAGNDQVTLNGKPLYTFALDGRGQAHGNGFKDNFDGMDFSWHSAVPAGATAPSAPASVPAMPGY
jgi:predicted lipoprotein with Yx(FWY)xxD motif